MKKKPAPDATRVELEKEIARYEWMSDEEVSAELAMYGIDPQPTIDAVTALVKARLEERDRRLLHQKAVLALGIAFATGAMRLHQLRRGARV